MRGHTEHSLSPAVNMQNLCERHVGGWASSPVQWRSPYPVCRSMVRTEDAGVPGLWHTQVLGRCQLPHSLSQARDIPAPSITSLIAKPKDSSQHGPLQQSVWAFFVTMLWREIKCSEWNVIICLINCWALIVEAIQILHILSSQQQRQNKLGRDDLITPARWMACASRTPQFSSIKADRLRWWQSWFESRGIISSPCSALSYSRAAFVFLFLKLCHSCRHGGKWKRVRKAKV